MTPDKTLESKPVAGATAKKCLGKLGRAKTLNDLKVLDVVDGWCVGYDAPMGVDWVFNKHTLLSCCVRVLTDTQVLDGMLWGGGS